jgi:hypothetical protein
VCEVTHRRGEPGRRRRRAEATAVGASSRPARRRWYTDSGNRALLKAICALIAPTVVLWGATPTAAGAVGLPGASSVTPVGSTGWVTQTLPMGFQIGTGGASDEDPVSCAPGTTFCVVIAGDPALIAAHNLIAATDAVTTSGTSWSGYTDIPRSFDEVTGLSCPTSRSCILIGQGPTDKVEVAVSHDGAKTWHLAAAPPGPTGWAGESVDCFNGSDCWVAGGQYQQATPLVATTTDWGAHWQEFHRLPAPTSYMLNDISCSSAKHCVAVGGNPNSNTGKVIITANGGQSWTSAISSLIAKTPPLFTVSCADDLDCSAGGGVAGGGALFLSSVDGGSTWSSQQLSSVGWVNSIACPDAVNCWVVGTATALALGGTTNGGASWLSYLDSHREVTAGTVACTTVERCWATQQGQLLATTDDGGLEQSVAVSITPTALAVPEINAEPGSVNLMVSDNFGRNPSVLQIRGPSGRALKITVFPGFSQRPVTLPAGVYEVEVPGSDLAPATFVMGAEIIA